MERRDFLKGSALLGAGATMGLSSIVSSCTSETGKVKTYTPEELGMFSFVEIAPGGKPLKAALIGCGSRGTGAAMQFLQSGPDVSIIAVADLFADRMNGCIDALKQKNNEIPESNRFIGFDAYKKVMEMPDVDLVLLCTPTHFRPVQFKAAIDAGKHVFMEKPCAVDPVGVRSVLATAKIAVTKGLTVISGTHLRHRRDYWEAIMQVRNGLIGDIISCSVHSNQGSVWYKTQRPEWSDMEYCIRNWFNIKWVSGDHIVDQAIHFIDIATWFMGQYPERAVGYGGRARRVTGDTFDFFCVDYYYNKNKKKMFTEARQIDGCDSDFSDQVYGTKGVVFMNYMNDDVKIVDYNGNTLWEYDYAKKPVKNPYEQEHIHLVESIRLGKKINQAEALAYSTQIAIMGREAAYTGKEVEWDEIMQSPLRYGPETYELGPLPDYHEGEVPKPGIPAK